MSKIYVTGFNGYLGSALCKHMFDKNFIKIGNPKKKIFANGYFERPSK
mgnify:CR=1 FL=1